VLIDGRFVIENGRRTDVLAGRSVRRPMGGRGQEHGARNVTPP
jgi:hypothetical protein